MRKNLNNFRFNHVDLFYLSTTEFVTYAEQKGQFKILDKQPGEKEREKEGTPNPLTM